jgi:hypothetical protein
LKKGKKKKIGRGGIFFLSEKPFFLGLKFECKYREVVNRLLLARLCKKCLCLYLPMNSVVLS